MSIPVNSSDLSSTNATEGLRYPGISVDYLFSVGHAGQQALSVIVEAALRTVIQRLPDTYRKKHNIMLTATTATPVVEAEASTWVW